MPQHNRLRAVLGTVCPKDASEDGDNGYTNNEEDGEKVGSSEKHLLFT